MATLICWSRILSMFYVTMFVCFFLNIKGRELQGPVSDHCSTKQVTKGLWGHVFKALHKILTAQLPLVLMIWPQLKLHISLKVYPKGPQESMRKDLRERNSTCLPSVGSQLRGAWSQCYLHCLLKCCLGPTSLVSKEYLLSAFKISVPGCLSGTVN